MTHAPLARAAAAIALGTLLLPSLAGAVTDEEVFRSLRFHVMTPGARAAGLGGAHIALADDPGAAYTNPAGLGFLDRPQLMLEMRGTTFDDSTRNTLGEIPGLSPELANGAILLEEDGVLSPSFLAYMHPIGEHFVIGVSRHEWLSLERDSFSSFTSSAFPQFEGSGAGISREGLSSIGSLDLLMDVYGVSFAGAPNEHISMGLTVSAARLDVVSTVDNFTYAVADVNGNGQADTLLRPIDYRTLIDDDDVQLSFSAGILWRPMDTIAIGASYREGPTFELEQEIRQEGVRAKDLREYLVSRGVANTNGQFINTISIPDSYGLGFAFGPYFEPRGGGGLTISVDAVHVEYADLLDGYVAGLNNQLFGTDSIGTTVLIEDETEFHLGIGYSWTVGYNNSIHIRGGAYTEPDHSITSAGRAGGFGSMPGRDDVTHGTLGAGFTVKRGFYSFQLDAAADVSDLGEQYFGSALFKF